MKPGYYQFYELASEEAADYLSRHVASADGVIERFERRVISITGVAPEHFDYREDGLRVIWEAVKPLYAEWEVDRYGFGGDDPPLWWRADDPASQTPKHVLWIRDGLIHYVSRCWMALSDRLTWDWERDQTEIRANQPVISGGFRGERVAPIPRVTAMCGGVVRGDDRFLAAYSNLACIAPIPGEPRVDDDRFEPHEIEVRVAELDDIQYEAANGRPEDWVGVWLVWLPESVELCGEGVMQDLEQDLLSRPQVGRVGYADEYALLVDAPEFAPTMLQQVTLDFLNARRQAGR